MIDFRYHVVSLVSVFLALAVGLVLGAGPLQNSLGSQLQRQVSQLRQDRDQLHADLATANTGIVDRDAFVTAVAGRLTGTVLAGQSVVLVRLPGAEQDDADQLTRVLQQAGATVTGRVDVRTDWTDPAKSQERQQLVTELTSTADSSVPVSPGSADTVLPQLLARGIVTAVTANAGQPDPAGQALLAGLRRGGLISVSGGVARRATEAVVLAPAVSTATIDAASATPTTGAAAEAAAAAWNRLVADLDAGGSGSVVTGPASSATRGGLVAAVRGTGSLLKTISTVDDGGTPMGAVTTALALREQHQGGVGSYGFGNGSQAVLPAAAAA